MNSFAFCSVVALALVGRGFAADVAQSCREGEAANFEAVQVFVGENECTSSPCDLVRGQTARCLITFNAVEGAGVLQQRINATTLGATVPFPVPDADKGCDKLTDGAYCPLDAGETATIQLAFDVLKLYPKVSLELVIFLLDENEKEVTCFKMFGNVVD